NTFDYSYENYIKLVLMIYTLSYISPINLTYEKIINQIGENVLFSTQDLKNMLKHLLIEREKTTEVYNQFKSSDERMKIYNYNPLRMKPILKKEEIIYLPMPHLLFKAITEGFYHWLCSQGKQDRFRRKFGKHVFENYVHHILQWDDSNYTIIPEFEYYLGKNLVRSSDFMLVKNSDLVLVEVKSTTPSNKLKGVDIGEYLKQLEKAYGIAVIQCLKKEKQLRNGELSHKKIPKNIDKVYYLIITLENFHIPPSSFMRENIYNICLEEGVELPDDKDFHAMGVEVLEEILEQDNRDIFQFLEYREESKHTFETFPSTDINKDFPLEETKMYKFWKKKLDEIKIIMFGN
ncbi:MAG: hypothetical protein ACOCRX_09330, partial [Candidatus Woesearchaeota archaeon]